MPPARGRKTQIFPVKALRFPAPGGDSRGKGRLVDLLLQRRVTAERTRALFVRRKEVSLFLVILSLSLSRKHTLHHHR